ncbi:hypothetical protein M427DRAFT_128896 [Gonapodya prolifera JEL478]|uniref:Dynein heavy chain, cytoplasmic n=1 Tax=Gonapodya prolifera (strain JEL478) TaxID=1344416 RepID=A0A138ZYF6_GONPJ|nr:hypothetical protein M427DRAFT_128896 [Gonapodya prolifera JEL478]|eukprot:KXS09529.1 hypothetical protein M427DRAFT_128896 [Gonapodya prolifera JEL478]
MWRRTVRSAKISRARQEIEQTLFACHPTLGRATLEARKLCWDLMGGAWFTKPGAAWLVRVVERGMDVEAFAEQQKSYVEEVGDSVAGEWRNSLRRVVDEACREVLKKTVDARATELMKDKGQQQVNLGSSQAKKMTFTEQAARRTESRRLERFVRVVDYMCVDALVGVAVDSVGQLLSEMYQGCSDGDVALAADGAMAPQGKQLVDDRSGTWPAGTVQVGGVVIGSEVGTGNLIAAGPDGFSNIVSNVLRQAVQKTVAEVIGRLVEEEDEKAGKKPDLEEIAGFRAPPPSLVPSSETKEARGTLGKDKDFHHTNGPLFRTKLLLEVDEAQGEQVLRLSPSLPEFVQIVDTLIKLYVTTVEEVSLLSGTFKYLDPSIVIHPGNAEDGVVEDALKGTGQASSSKEASDAAGLPNVAQIVSENPFFRESVGRIRGTLVGVFANARNWMKGWDGMRAMWAENNTHTVESVHLTAQKFLLLEKRKETPEALPPEGESVPSPSEVTDLPARDIVDFFSRALERFSSQRAIVNNRVPTSSVVNNVLIETADLKSMLIPSPEKCFKNVAEVLPIYARDRNEELLTEVQSWVRELNGSPGSVEHFVEYLGWMEKIKFSLPRVERQFEELNQLYTLVEKHKVVIQPTDLALYQTLTPTMRQLKDAADIANDSKDESINKFSMELEKNNTDLLLECQEIRNRAQDPMVWNPSGNPEIVLRFLDDMRDSLSSIEDRKRRYLEWSVLFKAGGTTQPSANVTVPTSTGGDGVAASSEAEGASPPVTTAADDQSGEIQETRQEVDLKRTLWASLRDWEVLTEKWRSSPFDQLNTDEINTQIQGYIKTIYALDKGLPPNEVVPKLKGMVEQFRTIYPCIVELRNPALKQRHWDKIQDAVGKSIIRDETFTLGRLLDDSFFDFKDEISGISGQASSEASLEEMLAKIVKQWSETEFSVLPYRDGKDVFILGSIDDIQTILEDSQVTLATIKSSRYIAPIKSDVDRWDKQLSLFAETLDAWLTCQRSWLYLESIFSAPDIQRQLPDEARMFTQVDRSWKEVMRKVSRNPNAMKSGTMPGLLETMQQNNALLDRIQKCLEDYLESKRLLFPRFYFLSNDELLEILSQTRNPQAVQPHLGKCFDAIKQLDFASESKSVDIVAMVSPEGERVPFGKTLKARGNVEAWLGQVEESMVNVLRKLCKAALAEYDPANRAEWVKDHVGMVSLTASQIIWCKDVSECLKQANPLQALLAFKNTSIQNLNQLAALVRGDLTKIQRAILGAMITIDVHNRDIIQALYNAKCSSPGDFEWTKQMRYYWDSEGDTCHVKMSTSTFIYGYEYLGCSPRLVITPLTDRCYLTLTGAVQLNLGGSPVGPAGTGKTETVKDLAKALARQCIVFNCSDGLDYKMMGKMFAGLAQSGAWICFDEFNRIDIEVLSVIAQQVITIKNAKDARATRFMFEGREIRLIDTCASFITMNPGYAGRTELPDNLKAMYRPIAMMIPDYGLIAEIILYSEGFENAKALSGKVVNLYKLCSEQLSQQDHYDFGMRAVKSVLVMAGSLKRANPSLTEDVVLIRSLRDSNLPKFISEDIPLFKGILQDLFPGIQVPAVDYGALTSVIQGLMKEKNLIAVPAMIDRIVQLYDTMKIRHGVMLVGPTGGGKTTSYQILAEAMGRLKDRGLGQAGDFQKIKSYVLNPKCITMAELYGEFNLQTMEWRDGLIGSLVRPQVTDNTLDEKWTVFDGPVDALWIENINSVLDDNKLLCLANGERIKLTPTMHMLFEVADLAVASPATVSRCGMVYMDPTALGWRPLVATWTCSLPSHVSDELKQYLIGLFEAYVDKGLKFVRKTCKEYVASNNVTLVMSLCKLIQTFLVQTKEVDFKQALEVLKPVAGYIFLFCYVWSIGGNLADGSHDAFDSFIHELFEQDAIPDVQLPSGNVFNYCVDVKNRTFTAWEDLVPQFKYSGDVPYFQLIVPTTDTVKYSFLLDRLLGGDHAVLLTGSTGVGKSVIVQDLLNRVGAERNYIPITLNFSAQTTSAQTQSIIESKLEKKRKNILGAPEGSARVVLFVDDLNMPKLDRYGSQPTIELLRQYLTSNGWYDREKLFWKEIQDVSLVGACGPPGGGRNPITGRLLRHFNLINIPAPQELSLLKIFKSIMEGFFRTFSADVRGCCDNIVGSAIEIYRRMCTELLPTPAKSHYTFNLRDLSKVVQGVLQVKPAFCQVKNDVIRLFCHEAARVFHDRLIDDVDRLYFNQLISEVVEKSFTVSITKEQLVESPILFGDFLKRGVPVEERNYVEITDSKALGNMLEEYLEEYNVTLSKDMRLIFFLDAKQHITRIARILRQPRGNALLVGVGGTGKQSLTRLACHISEYQCIQIELTRTYGETEWHEDLKKLYQLAGVEGKTTVFLLSDTQIKSETFLEDVNNILNSGEVPNLFEVDEREKILGDLRPLARQQGFSEDRDTIYQFFINRVKDNLHIVFATSPVGDMFRNRCRMFPSLVNCSTIDWFNEWPREALLSVSRRFLEFVDLGSDEMKDKVSSMCVEIHVSVSDISTRYWNEIKRRYYTTPTSYLELINLYTVMLGEKRKELGLACDRLKNGLSKLAETNELVAKMQVELELLGPELKQKAKDVETLMAKIAKDQETADGVRKVVAEEESVVREKAEQTEGIARDAQKDLDEALPALAAAYSALDALDKKDIAELKVFSKPPDLVMLVMEAVCILFKVKADWDSSKKLLADPQFMKKMVEFDKDNIPDSILKKLRKYIENPSFTPDAVEKVSKACKSICMWVVALELYGRVYREVQPKRKRLEDAQATLEATRAKLAEKTAALQEVESQLNKLKQKYEDSIASKKQLADKIDETSRRLQRASKLTQALADEQIRWTESVASLGQQIEALVGNVFLAAACVAYYGAFTFNFRQDLVSQWISKCQSLGIPVLENFALVDILGDPVVIREWNVQGLPTDALSTDNGILVHRGRRWPLMIDPQGQANNWIRKMEGPDLKIVKLSDSKFLRTLENAIRTGSPVLMEDVGEQLDPALEPLLLKQTVRQGGRLMMKLGDTFVEYDKNFRLYITSKLPNPHYLPEVCIKATIINFTVTKNGLENQLLGDVVCLERPELEEQRNNLIISLSADKKALKDIEEKILKLLFNAQGNILDDEELINTLNQSKVTSAAILERVKLSEQTEKAINIAREKYRPVAIRGSVLYFAVADLAEVDPMYQFSLKYFKNMFNSCIESCPKTENLNVHIEDLNRLITSVIFQNISRALFERHKMIFSFMICTEIMRERKYIEDTEWNYFLRGGSGVTRPESFPPRPQVPWLTDSMWRNVVELTQSVAPFKFIVEHMTMYPSEWEVIIESDDPFLERIPGEGGDKVSDFQKLLLIKTLREEKLIPSAIEFIKRGIGKDFIEVPPLEIGRAYKDTNARTPFIFILSAGSDPIASLLRFAKEINYGDRLHMISLGQGQGPIAEELVKKAMSTGDWVFLQNCHLAASWMTRLDQLVRDISSPETQVNPSFRLFLSSMPSRVFPIAVLQEGVKVTNEPPKGLRANLARSFADVSPDVFDVNPPQGTKFKKLLFGVCFFNALIHERKKFGPLGWNILYDWSNSDLEVSITIMKNFLQEYRHIPWDALLYLTGEITFGGRVTDDWDRRTLRSILQRFYTPAILEDGHKFSPSGVYYAPGDGNIASYRSFIDKLPITEDPSIFGMHENANISFQVQESRRLVRTVLDVQPRIGVAGGGKSPEQIVTDLTSSILEEWPSPLVLEYTPSMDSGTAKAKTGGEGERPASGSARMFRTDADGRVLNSLSIVLSQECARFNKLLTTVKKSLESLVKAIKGLVVMNEELEAVFRSLLNNEVPASWANVAYPSLKPLGGWVKDLQARIAFMRSWIDEGQPTSFWLPGFFFPQGFLTGALQNHARKYNIPIDSLTFSFILLDAEGEAPAGGGTGSRGSLGSLQRTEGKEDDGVLIRGLFLEGARWDPQKRILQDSFPMEMYSTMPLVRFLPTQTPQIADGQNKLYVAPLYKTAARAGTLSTTGHSTNFVLSINVPSDRPQEYWIAKGCALLCQLSE